MLLHIHDKDSLFWSREKPSGVTGSNIYKQYNHRSDLYKPVTIAVAASSLHETPSTPIRGYLTNARLEYISFAIISHGVEYPIRCRPRVGGRVLCI